MMTKEYTFEELGPDENLAVSIDLEFSYFYDGGKLYGDDAYPAEEDGEICEPVDLAEVVAKELPNETAEVHAMVLAEIRAKLEEMNKDLNLVAEWYADEEPDGYDGD